MQRVLWYLVLYSLIVNFTGCTPAKRIAYFQDIADSATSNSATLPEIKFQDPIIRSNDLLRIGIKTLNSLEDVNVLNTEVSANGPLQTARPIQPTEFVVDSKGDISVPLIGKMNVNGLTTESIRDSIQSKMERYLIEPVVDVHLINFTVTVLGEVNRPANYLVPSQKVSILDALGMAGDLTIYGKRENVLLIRNSLANRQAIRLNLNSSSIFQSPFFYLRQGDIIYVEPDKSKVNSLDATKTRNYALMASGLSVLIVLISRINF